MVNEGKPFQRITSRVGIFPHEDMEDWWTISGRDDHVHAQGSTQDMIKLAHWILENLVTETGT